MPITTRGNNTFENVTRYWNKLLNKWEKEQEEKQIVKTVWSEK